MTLQYKLTNDDFLTYQLYASSKSKLHKKRRFLSKIMVPIVYTIVGLYFALKEDNFDLLGIMISIGLLWFAFYPMYSKWKYQKHFQKHVKENYQNRINKSIEIKIDENSVKIKDYTSESKIKGSELKELIETTDYFFIKLSTDLSLIIPKHAIEEKKEFKKLVLDLGAKYIDELDWQWK